MPAPVELNMPVDKSTPFKMRSPAVNVYVPVAVRAYALLNVAEPAVCVNVATALNVAVAAYVKVPDPSTKLTVGVRVPDDKLNIPLRVNVVHCNTPMLVYVPDVNATVPEQVKLNVAKLIAPAVCVNVVQNNAL